MELKNKSPWGFQWGMMDVLIKFIIFFSLWQKDDIDGEVHSQYVFFSGNEWWTKSMVKVDNYDS